MWRASELPKWDPANDLKDSFFMVMYGRPRSGKSYLTKDILYKVRRRFDDQIFLFTTNATNPYSDLMGSNPAKRVFQGFSDPQSKKSFDMIIRYQTDLISRFGQKNTRPALLIFDDSTDEGNKQHSDQALQTLSTHYRHLNISVIICVQYLKLFPPCLRSCVSHAILMNQINGPVIKALQDEYLGCIPDPKTRREVFDRYTKMTNALVVSCSWSDVKLYQYKATNQAR